MIIPLKDNLVIEIHKIAETAMLMVDSKEGEMEKATVIACGNDVVDIKVGDVIYFKNYETDTILDGDEKFVIIKEESVKALCHTIAPTKQ